MAIGLNVNLKEKNKMFISNDEKNLINARLKHLDESVNVHAYKLHEVKQILEKIMKHLSPKPPAKKRGRPLGAKNKPKTTKAKK